MSDLSGLKKSAILLPLDNQRADVSYLYTMTVVTITFDSDVKLDKLHFRDLEDFQEYLANKPHLMPHETPEFFAHLLEIDRKADENPSTLRTWEDVEKRLDALKKG